MTPVQRPWRRTLRTAVQAAVAFGIALPGIYSAATGNAPEAATGWVGAGIAASAALARIMAIPSVDVFLSRFGLGSASRAELTE